MCSDNIAIIQLPNGELAERYIYLCKWCNSMIPHLGQQTALPAYLLISSYAKIAIISLINRSNACNCRTHRRFVFHICVATDQQIEFDHQYF